MTPSKVCLGEPCWPTCTISLSSCYRRDVALSTAWVQSCPARAAQTARFPNSSADEPSGTVNGRWAVLQLASRRHHSPAGPSKAESLSAQAVTALWCPAYCLIGSPAARPPSQAL